MAINYPGPFAIELNYSAYFNGAPFTHKFLGSCELQTTPNVGDPFSGINVKLNNGTFVALDVAIENMLAVWAPRYATTTTFDFVDLWQYTPLSFQRSFISSYAPTLSAGTSVSATNPSQYEMYTFRTGEGGVARVTLLETTDVANVQKGYAGLAANQKNVADFYSAPTSGFVIGRDTSRIVSFIRESSGTNEALFRKRFR